jgi:hypothetical protein
MVISMGMDILTKISHTMMEQMIFLRMVRTGMGYILRRQCMGYEALFSIPIFYVIIGYKKQ